MKKKNSIIKISIDRNIILLCAYILCATALIIQLINLQIISYAKYKKIAAREHYGYSELPAYRGEIFIKDYGSGDLIRVATNITLDLLYADPTMIKDKKLAADSIVPLIYNLEEARENDQKRVKTQINRAKNVTDIESIKPYSDEELYKNFYNDILEKLSSDIRPMVILKNELNEEQIKSLEELDIEGLAIFGENQLRAYPPRISNIKTTSQILSRILDMPALEIESRLTARNRYVVIKRRIDNQSSQKIKELLSSDEGGFFTGLRLQEEYFRYYPEKNLASNIIGFLNQDGNGTYGIESRYNTELKGKKGVFETQKDSIGRLITVGESLIQPAIDGENIVLTIDRSIQLAVERMLERSVINTRSDSGQVVIMDPKSGKIIALAHYPSFDPNNFGNVYEKEDVFLTEKEINELIPIENMENTFWLYRNFLAMDRTMIFKKTLDENTIIYQKYKNNIGPEAYQNKIVSQPYEPGSVFKIILMAIAIDDQEIEPGSVFNDPGILEVDEFKITNVSNQCGGRINATQILAYSCNTGMGRIAQRVGRNLFYSYMKRFGFGERTEIEFEHENTGKLSHFNTWAESELVTHAFGQGFTATPIQMITAISAIANKGIMMQPHIIEKIEKKPGEWIETQKIALGQIITEKTAETMKQMMVASIENGVATNAKMNKYFIAGKTGTSQTYRHGKPLTGIGTTIASIAGFGPVADPKFVILVKLDHPRSSVWADSTAAFLFKEIAEYLFEYYSIPPDK